MNKQYKINITQNHPFYLVDSSTWPLVASLGILFITFGGVIYMHLYKNGLFLFLVGLFIIYCWWRNIVRRLYFDLCIQSIELLWILGVLFLVLIMATAFLGYALPWGQMSFWGVTVITNFFSAIPYVGKSIVEWLWGGFSIGNPTLNRFFSFHYLFPFIIAGVSTLFFSKQNKKDNFSQNGSKFLKNKIKPLTLKNRNLFFYHVQIPSFLSIKDCRYISQLLKKSLLFNLSIK